MASTITGTPYISNYPDGYLSLNPFFYVGKAEDAKKIWKIVDERHLRKLWEAHGNIPCEMCGLTPMVCERLINPPPPNPEMTKLEEKVRLAELELMTRKEAFNDLLD